MYVAELISDPILQDNAFFDELKEAGLGTASLFIMMRIWDVVERTLKKFSKGFINL